MTPPADTSRVFRIGEADATLPDDVPSRACTIAGCSGTMYLHDPMQDPPGPTHLEFPTYATWVCANDPTHVELLALRQWSQEKAARIAERLPTSLKGGRSQAIVLDIWGTGPKSGEIRPGRLVPCPTKLCAVAGCQATMDLLLSHDEYPRGDAAHLDEWPHLYRRWVCQRDKTHFRNVTADEWQAVKQFHVDAMLERQQSRLGLGDIVLMVVILPFALLGVLFMMIKDGVQRRYRSRPAPDGEDLEQAGVGRRRACTVTGCTGTMYLHDPIEAPPPPTHLEFPRCATWVCANDPSHVDLVPLRQGLRAR